MPVMSGTSHAGIPFWVACAPSTIANGTNPNITGNEARIPRATSSLTSDCADDAAEEDIPDTNTPAITTNYDQ
ncbi:hypothetical protein THI4931_05960 [Pandoraea sputorum]|nr:hypothetical protein THI4931_05960 [Pandoraea sputorum]